MDHLPLHTVRCCVTRYRGEHTVKRFSCLDQSLCMAFAQLTYRESLRDIEACLRARCTTRSQLGIRGHVARHTLAHANATRDWRMSCDFAQSLIARRWYAKEPFGLDVTDTVYALDSTTIDLCLSVFPWAPFRSTTAAVKQHTLLDLRGRIPSLLVISDGTLHDVTLLDHLPPELGAFSVMDRADIDFDRLARFDEAGSFFVTRATSNLTAQRRDSHAVDRTTGLVCDQTVVLTGFSSRNGFETPLRRITFTDPDTGTRLVFLTTHVALSALPITHLSRMRWRVELCVKWGKQHRRITVFFGTSETAVTSQIWIAVSVSVLVAIVTKRLNLSARLYDILQILSLTTFERTPLNQLLRLAVQEPHALGSTNQLTLFE